MRKAWLAVGALVIAAGLGYAYSREMLPPAATRAIEGGLAFFRPSEGASAKPAASAPRRPTPVEVARAVSTEPVREIEAIGSILADESVQIAAEQAGRVASIGFDEGQPVEAGQELVKLDDSLLAAELGEVEARASLAQANYERAQTLSSRGSGTQRSLDEAAAERLTANALLTLLRSRIDKTSIRAPFAGIVGLRTVSIGAYVEPGDALTRLEKIDVVKVDFTVPERNLADIRQGLRVDVTVDAFPGRSFTGEIYAIDPQVDVGGRALKVRARIDNPDLALRPGLFARVRVQSERTDAVVMVPEGAIVPKGGESFVFKVVDGAAAETKVALGQRGKGMVEVVSGVAAGDAVVVAGQQRLRNGSTVEVVDVGGAAGV